MRGLSGEFHMISDHKTVVSHAVVIVVRLFIATTATALLGALVIVAYELFAAGDRSTMGSPLEAVAELAVLTGPFILFGLIVLGLPVSFVLWRLRIESTFSYILAGALAGVAFGFVVLRIPAEAGGAALVASYGAMAAVCWRWSRYPN